MLPNRNMADRTAAVPFSNGKIQENRLPARQTKATVLQFHFGTKVRRSLPLELIPQVLPDPNGFIDSLPPAIRQIQTLTPHT